jgi:hypothetical protein
VQIREFDGVPATNRVGAAEYLGRSLQTINQVAAPKNRARTGWPAPVGRADRQQWYALPDLDAFRVSYVQTAEDTHRARVHDARLTGRPDELVTAVEFRKLIDAPYGTWARYVHDSKPAWQRGEDGYLPRPDATEPARRGEIRKWRRRRVQDWINSRPGKVPSPGRPPRTGRAAPTEGT